MSFDYLAQETGYLEKPALHPDQTTNDQEIHRLKLSFLDKLMYGSEGDGILNQHSPKIVGAFFGAAYAFYSGKRPVWPFAFIGGLLGWVCQLKSTSPSAV